MCERTSAYVVVHSHIKCRYWQISVALAILICRESRSIPPTQLLGTMRMIPIFNPCMLEVQQLAVNYRGVSGYGSRQLQDRARAACGTDWAEWRG